MGCLGSAAGTDAGGATARAAAGVGWGGGLWGDCEPARARPVVGAGVGNTALSDYVSASRGSVEVGVDVMREEVG